MGAGAAQIVDLQTTCSGPLSPRYSILPHSDPERCFSIGPDDGSIRTAVPLDRETRVWHNLTVLATELGEESAPAPGKQLRPRMAELSPTNVCPPPRWQQPANKPAPREPPQARPGRPCPPLSAADAGKDVHLVWGCAGSRRTLSVTCHQHVARLPLPPWPVSDRLPLSPALCPVWSCHWRHGCVCHWRAVGTCFCV